MAWLCRVDSWVCFLGFDILVSLRYHVHAFVQMWLLVYLIIYLGLMVISNIFERKRIWMVASLHARMIYPWTKSS